jgi:hypothetical protein
MRFLELPRSDARYFAWLRPVDARYFARSSRSYFVRPFAAPSTFLR